MHVFPQLSLVANYSTGNGLPNFNFAVLPEGKPGKPSDGEGKDFGVAFNLLDNRISGRLVYFETFQKDEVSGLTVGNNFSTVNKDIMDAFAAALVGAGRPYTAAEWASIYARWVPNGVTADLQDTRSRGMELSLTANLTKNWRLTFNASKTDRQVTDIYRLVIPWLGYQRDEKGLLKSGITVAGGTYTLANPEVYVEGGAIREWLRLLAQTGQTVNTFNISNRNAVLGSVMEDFQRFRLNDR
jgi:outer membrane receptor protein involved in Fe transport